MANKCAHADLVNELRRLVGQPMDELDGVVLVEILCFAGVRLPSGNVINTTDATEVLGREDCAAIVADLMGTIDPAHLKVASLSKNIRYGRGEFDKKLEAWQSKLREADIVVTYP